LKRQGLFLLFAAVLSAAVTATGEVSSATRIRLVKDINRGSSNGLRAGNQPTSFLTAVGARLFFVARDGVHGWELWKSDGTRAGTVLVKDINPSGSSNPWEPTSVDGTLFFSADDGVHGFELWRSEGMRAGTVLVKDINQAGDSGPCWLTAVGHTLFFEANSEFPDLSGTELWKSDGTSAGTVLVKTFSVPSDLSYSPCFQLTELTSAGRTLFFAGDDGVHGSELWKCDGTRAGTRMVKDINPAGPTSRYYFHYLTNVQGTVYFSADDGVHGSELWKSDGTRAGTVMVKDINTSGDSGPHDLLAVGGTLFFEASDEVHDGVWRSDGTAAGTVLVKEIEVLDIRNIGGELLLNADDGVHGFELWKSDGTEVGTVMVKDINPSAGSGPFHFIDAGAKAFFFADDGTHGYELWETDGTSDGTVQVTDFFVDTPKAWRGLDLAKLRSGTVFFSADDGSHGQELWEAH
jgi:ELWxxDGT repeat protein